MALTKVTALEFESLVQATETPSPIPIRTAGGLPINPMTMPADWGAEIVIKTRWQTDATTPVGSNRTERWSLASRPARTLSVTLTGMERDEANAMLQAAASHTSYHGAPVPIYPDAVAVFGSDGVAVFGDFRWRRFFRKGRVVVYPTTPSTSKSSDDVFFATIESIAPDRVVLDAVPRTITSDDTIAPCFDAEIMDEVSGVSETDSLWSCDMEWSEVEGACSLPAIWPAVLPENAEVLSPICQIVDNLAVFPFEPNWASGIDVGVVRDMDTSPMGRSQLKSPSGFTYHKFSMTLMGYTRERAWSILRFFDAMRGRAGSFYFVHPLRPFRPWTTVVPSGGAYGYIQPIGDQSALISFLGRVAFFRADGTFVTRRVNTITDAGDHFSLLLDTPLPDTAFVDIQPVFVCSFESDEIEETWATTSVATEIPVTIIQNPDPGIVSSPSLTGLLFTQPSPAFLSIPDLDLLLRAGAGMLDAFNKGSTTWPGNATVAKWRDVSSGPSRQNRTIPVTKELLRANSRPNLVRFPGPWENNKQPCVICPNFTLDYQLTAETPSSQRSLWGPEGWTLCICITPSKRAAANVDKFLALIQEGIATRFALLSDTSSAWPAKAGIAIANAAGTTTFRQFNLDYRDFDAAVYFTIRVDATHVRAWINGQQAFSSAFALTGGIYTATQDFTTSEWFSGLDLGYAAPTSAILKTAFADAGCANLLASYKRALEVDELDALHTIVSDMYRASFDPVSLYA